MLLRYQFTLVSSALVFFVGVVTHTSTAKAADPFLRLDNYPNGGTVNYTTTNHAVTVWVRFCGSAFFEAIDSRALTTVSGQHDYAWPYSSTRTGDHVEDVKVAISGDDWFWLDQIELFDEFGNEIWSWGVDNTNGACLSTDPDDPAPLEDPGVCWPTGTYSSKTWYDLAGWCN